MSQDNETIQFDSNKGDNEININNEYKLISKEVNLFIALKKYFKELNSAVLIKNCFYNSKQLNLRGCFYFIKLKFINK